MLFANQRRNKQKKKKNEEITGYPKADSITPASATRASEIKTFES